MPTPFNQPVTTLLVCLFALTLLQGCGQGQKTELPNASSLTIDANNAQSLASQVLRLAATPVAHPLAGETTLVISQNKPNQILPIFSSQGSCGGEYQLSFVQHDNAEDDRFVLRFNSFCSDDKQPRQIENGFIAYSALIAHEQGQRIYYEFDNYRRQDDLHHTDVDGYCHIDQFDNGDVHTHVDRLRIADLTTDPQSLYQLENFVRVQQADSAGELFQLYGSILFDQQGLLSLTTNEPLYWIHGETLPISGILTLRGAQNSRLRIIITQGEVLLVLNNQELTTISWPEFFPQLRFP